MEQWSSRKWSKWANSLFKRDKPLGSEPWFNPEAVTEQKREWLEQQQKAQGAQEVRWPEHIYENFFIVGLPPDMELTQVAEQLCDLERKKQRTDSDNDTEPPTKEHLQPPQPSFTPQVLLRAPPGAPAPISDDEVAAFCFPSGVAPEKLKRTPSLSALDELVMGRDSDQQQQCFVFMLKVGGNFPLYGCCWYVREMLHRPPYLARQQYRSCRAPFRQCMIAAPRCYCLLSYYPFFDLHFRVLKIVLDLERLERLLDYDSEKSKLRPPGPNLLAPSSPRAHAPTAASGAAGGRRSLQDCLSAGGSSAPGSNTGSLANSRAQSPVFGARPARSSAAGSSAGGASVLSAADTTAGAARVAEPAMGITPQAGAAAAAGPARRQTPDGDVQAHVVHNRQLYCAECAGIIEDMCPFTPGSLGPDSGPAASPPSWTLWQQQRRRGNSPMGPEGEQQQHGQPAEEQHEAGKHGDCAGDGGVQGSHPQLQRAHSSDAAAVGVPVRCEVCGKRLRMSTPEGLLPESSNTSAAVAAAAGAPAASRRATSAAGATADGGGSSRAAAAGVSTSDPEGQQALVRVIAGVLPARLTAALQPSGSCPAAPSSQQQQQQQQQQPGLQQRQPQQQAQDAVAAGSAQFDAVAAASAAFDAAGAPGAGTDTADQWTRWQGVVSALRGANGVQQQQQQPQLSHGGASNASLQDSGLHVVSSAPGPETSMVQRMWETWAPRALEGSPCDASVGTAARLSGGLGLFKRPSRASGNLEQAQATTRNNSPAAEATARGEAAAALQQQQQQRSAAGAAADSGVPQPCAQEQVLLLQQHQQQQPHPALAPHSGEPAPQQHQQQQLDQPGFSIHQQHQALNQQQQPAATHHGHGPSRLRPSLQQPQPLSAPSAVDPAAAGAEDVAAWQADLNLRPLRSFRHPGDGDGSRLPNGLEGLRDISTTSNASFYSVDDAPASSSNTEAQLSVTQEVPEQHKQLERSQQQLAVLQHPQPPQQQVLQQVQLPAAVAQQELFLRPRGKSEQQLLQRQPSPPLGQLPLVQLHGRRQQRWSDPSSWPSRPRTPSPLPLLQGSQRMSQGGQPSNAGSAGSDCIVSAFAAIAAAAEPFEAASAARPAVSQANSKAVGPTAMAGELDSASSADSVLDVVEVSAAGGTAPEGTTEASDSSSQGGVARVNVTIGGGSIPMSDGKLQVQLQPVPSRSGSGRRSALFEEVALRRSGDMSNELRVTISHLVQVDSGTLLAAYYTSPVPQPGETYRLMLGDLYRLEFERALPLQQYAPPGRTRLRQELLTYAEVECAQHLQLWTVAALCRSLSVDNIITLVNAVLLEKQLVVFCPHIGTLGSVVLSLVPLLRPFTWQSLVMPVTPVSMLGFLDAPVPFVLGVQYKTPDVASRCHGLLRVNVYKDAIKNASFPALPNTRQLAAALAPYHAALCEAAPLAVERPVHVITPDEDQAAHGFLGVMHDYLSKLCGDLRLHTIVNVGMSKRTGIFMKESLLESLPAKDRPFMRAFMETQMFAAYADGVISDYCES